VLGKIRISLGKTSSLSELQQHLPLSGECEFQLGNAGPVALSFLLSFEYPASAEHYNTLPGPSDARFGLALALS
jgi:hypothetical protein